MFYGNYNAKGGVVMADFSADFDINQILGGLSKMADSDEVAIEMVNSGLEVLKKAIEKGAVKHKITGDMAKSIYIVKARRNKDGDIVGRVKFGGSSGQYKNKKTGKRFDITNWIKAFRIEYGTSKQKAKPFVRPAIQASRVGIKKAMDSVFDKEVKK